MAHSDKMQGVEGQSLPVPKSPTGKGTGKPSNLPTSWKAAPTESFNASKENGTNEEQGPKRARANTDGKVTGEGAPPSSSGKGKGKGKGKARRKRRSTQGKKPEYLKTKDPALRYILNIMSRLILQTQSMVRTALGLLLTTIIIDKTTEPAVSAITEQQNFKNALRELRSSDEDEPKPLGAPHLQIFHSFMLGLSKAPDIGAPNRDAITAWITEADSAPDPPGYIQEYCQSFQVFNVRSNEEKCRLQIAMPAGNIRSHVLKAIENIGGARISSGPAPRGFLEEELSDWISMLEDDALKPKSKGKEDE